MPLVQQAVTRSGSSRRVSFPDRARAVDVDGLRRSRPPPGTCARRRGRSGRRGHRRRQPVRTRSVGRRERWAWCRQRWWRARTRRGRPGPAGGGRGRGGEGGRGHDQCRVVGTLLSSSPAGRGRTAGMAPTPWRRGLIERLRVSDSISCRMASVRSTRRSATWSMGTGSSPGFGLAYRRLRSPPAPGHRLSRRRQVVEHPLKVARGSAWSS